MRKSIRIVLNLVLILSFAAAAQAQFTHPQPRAAWVFKAQNPVRSTPAVLENAVYIGDSRGDLHVLNLRTGEQLWSLPLGSEIASTPLVRDRFVYVTDRSGTLTAIRHDKQKVQWSFSTEPVLRYENGWDYYVASPIADEEHVYFASGDSTLYALNHKGKLQWSFKADGILRSTPALTDGRLYVGSMGGTVTALDPESGSVIWSYKTLGNEYFPKGEIWPPLFTYEGVVYAGSRDSRLYALDGATGEVNWMIDHEGSWIGSGVTFGGGRLYLTSSDGQFIQALNPIDGEELWRIGTGKNNYATPLFYQDRLYVASTDGLLYGLDASTGEILWRYASRNDLFGTPILAGDRLIYGGDDGRIIALQVGADPDEALHARMVYWDSINSYPVAANHEQIKNFLQAEGYVTLEAEDLVEAMEFRSQKEYPGVIVFAVDPVVVTGEQGVRMLRAMRAFLESGGRMVWIGMMPNLLRVVQGGNEVGWAGLEPAEALLDIPMKGVWYDEAPLFPTALGRKVGLVVPAISLWSVDADLVSDVLAEDVHGRAGMWTKQIGEKGGLFIRAFGDDTPVDMNIIRSLAEGSYE